MAQIQMLEIIGIILLYMKQQLKERLMFSSCSYNMELSQPSRNTVGRIALDLADLSAKAVLTGEYKKDELLESARSGNEEKIVSLLTPLNVNSHVSDGKKSTPLHLAAGYNRVKIVQLLLQHGADVHAKDKGDLMPLHNAFSYSHYEVTTSGQAWCLCKCNAFVAVHYSS